MNRTHVRAAASLAFVALLATVSIMLSRPSAVASGPVDPTDFSAEGAMTHLREIARQPRPMGSKANREVRDYLLRALRELGLEPEVQSQIAANRWYLVRAENIVARLRGTGGSAAGSAILLVAHYDSVPMSRGAGDAGSGVVTILETLRALKAGPQLKNDVIVLLTNPEEIGLHGAMAFVDSHPWLTDVGFVLNMDPGGVSGPALMHETSDQNGWLIAQLDKAVPQLFGSSLAGAVKKALNDRSDEFRVFAAAGKAGANVSFIGSDTHYHSALDRPENIDLRSLQNLGGYALGLTRHLGDHDRVDERAPDAIYFNTLGSWVVQYPESWRWFFFVVTAVLFVVATTSARRHDSMTLPRLLGAFGAQLAVTALAIAGSAGLWALLERTDRASGAFLTGDQYQSWLFLLGFAGLTLVTTSAGYALVARKIGLHTTLLGASLVWLLISGALCLWLPGASYLFTWPPLASLASLPVAGFLKRRKRPLLHDLALLIGGLPALVLTAPIVVTVFGALATGEGPYLMALVALVLGLLAPTLWHCRESSPRLLPAVGIAVCLAALSGIFLFSFDAQHPRTSFLVYGLDGDSGTAVWATRSRAEDDLQPDEWNESLFAGATERGNLSLFYPFTSRDFLQAEAPVVDLPLPQVELVDEEIAAGHRRLRLRVTSPREAPLAIVVTSVPIASWTLDDVAIGHNQIVSFRPTPPQGFILDIETLDLEPLEISVIDTSFGLPQESPIALGSRPSHLMPEPAGGLVFTDATHVRATFTF